MNSQPIAPRSMAPSRSFFAAMVLFAIAPAPADAEPQESQPVLEFATGLPGRQVQLSWDSAPGVRYRVEKSGDLGAPGGDGWQQVAVVTANGPRTEWKDPQAVTDRCFYRVTKPQAEVLSISPPLLSPTGGTITVHGQCIPDGSFLVLEIEGLGLVSAELFATVAGEWNAEFTVGLLGGALPGAQVISARVVHGITTLATIDQQIEITATGLASDGPVAMPPAAPVPVFASKPVPGIGVIVKKGPLFPKGTHGKLVGKEECDDGNLEPDDGTSRLAPLFSGNSAHSTGGNWPVRNRGVKDVKTDPANMRSAGSPDEVKDPTAEPDALLAMWLSKKGYDYYKAKSDMNAAGLPTNPAFQEHKNEGQMVRTMPAPSGLPGEVAFQTCDLALPTPAGPQLAWVRTYRSKKPVSSGHGPQWDFSYNIRIEPLPSTAGVTAPRLVLHDGGGRSDVMYRQADGTYRCDGMFREGKFDGLVFTLTFADKGKWTFHALDGSPTSGKISAITCRFGVSLACSYDGSGRLQTVSDSFSPPRSLTVTWAGNHIASVADTSGRSVSFSQYALGEAGGSEGDLKQATPTGFGATVYSYTSGNTDDALNHNLLEVRDGEGRLLEGFGYSSDPDGIAYDTCSSHNRHMTTTGHVSRIKFANPGASTPKGYAIYENDEVGRVTETLFDAQHREIRVREYTGFWSPGTEVGPSDLGAPVTPKLRASDPDFYESSAKFNADHQCVQLTRPDGSQIRVVHEREFRPGGPVRERGNARVLTLRTATGEERTVTCDYLPGFGTQEPSAKPGSPIKGISVKGGRHPGGSIGSSDRPGNPIGGLTIKGGQNPKRGEAGMIWSPRSNYLDDDDDGDGWAARGGGRRGWDGTVKGSTGRIDEGGRHTPFHNSVAPLHGGFERGITINTTHVEYATGFIRRHEECDDNNTDPRDGCARQKHKGWDGTIKGLKVCDGFVTRMTNAYGQSMTWDYNEGGACTSALITSIPSYGQVYQYNSRGQCISVTILNGPGSSFTNEMTYNPDTGFLGSLIRDKASSGSGLQLTTTIDRDAIGRVIRVVEPTGTDWLYEYNSLDQCTLVQSPGPNRISVNLTYDNAGRVIRRDQAHLGADGLPVSTNPSYSTFYRYDSRARLDQVADEERPVDGSAASNAAALGIENFAVCDITRDAAGQITRLSTPAACRAQSTDLVCDFVYDERGELFRRVAGGAGASGSVTEQFDYTPDGSLARFALLGSGVPDSVETYEYDGFHRLTSTTNPQGVVLQLSYDNVGFTQGSVYSSPSGGTGTGELMSLWRMRKRPEILFQAWDNEIDGFAPASPFFDYLTEDDTLIEDRFTPGSGTGFVAQVITNVDRSPAGLVQSVTRNGDLLVSLEYDTAGRLTRCSNGACRVDLERDGLDDVVVCGRTDHFRVAGAPPTSETFTHTYVRDSLGRVTQQTDGVGNTSTFAYDSFGRCVSAVIPGRAPVLYAYDGSDASGPFAQRTSCDVAGTGTPVVLGTLRVRCGHLRSTTDSFGHSVAISEDGLGRVVARQYPDGTEETVSYDSLGFVSGRSYRDGVSVTFTTDALGRVTEIGWPGNPATYQYDALGRRVSAAQGTSAVTFAYDSLGNPVSETQTGVASSPQTITRSFDHRGRNMITYPDGSSFIEARDEFGNLLAVSALSAPPASPPLVAIEYCGHRVWRTVHANGVESVHNYRSDGETSPAGGSDQSFDNCVSRTTKDPHKVVICHGTARRAPDQSILRTETYFEDGPAAAGRWKIFTRDNLGRVTACLTQVRSSTGVITTESEVSYTLDLEGRRVSEVRDGIVGSYTQDNTLPPGDQQAGQYSTWPGGALDWDPAGNLLSMRKGGDSFAFVHDVQGRLVACNQLDALGGPPVTLVEFSHDALGRVMVHKVHNGGSITETRFIYDGEACIQELTPTGEVAAAFVCADGAQEVFSKPGEQLFVHRGLNHWGDRVCPGGSRSWPTGGYAVTMVTGSDGTPAEHLDFDDAGKPIFLDATGTLTSAGSSSTGLNRLDHSDQWVPQMRIFAGPRGAYSPELGMQVSTEKPKTKPKSRPRHVIVMK